MDRDDENLLESAREAIAGSWAPYSGFHVGAALRVKGGRVFTGANVENASFGLTICAERAAVFKAVNEGVREFEAIAVACDGEQPVTPCGACLQVLKEFTASMPVLLCNTLGSIRTTSLQELLPAPFDGTSLGKGGARP